MKGIVSGNYPSSIIRQAIEGIQSTDAGDLRFEVGDAIADKAFDFNLQTVSELAAIIGVALSAIQMVWTVMKERAQKRGVGHVDLKEMAGEINRAMSGLPSSRDFDAVTDVVSSSSERIELIATVESKLHIQRMEARCIVSVQERLCRVELRPIKRGN